MHESVLSPVPLSADAWLGGCANLPCELDSLDVSTPEVDDIDEGERGEDSVGSEGDGSAGLDVGQPELRRWLTSIQRRDEKGLRLLFGRCQSRVRLAALGIVRRHDLAGEVVSATFLQVWDTAASFDPDRGSVMTWLLLIARSRSIDALRRQRNQGRHEVPMDEDFNGESARAFDGVNAPALDACRSRSRQLQRAMLRLSPIQRQVLALTVVRGLSQEEASSWLEMPLGTVKSHARRGLGALRQHCEAMGLSAG